MPTQEIVERVRKVFGVPATHVPSPGDVIRTAAEAEAFLRRAIPNLEIEMDPGKVIEADTWWYLPLGWIGCAGYIIDKDGTYVNELGSCHSLDDCCWAHSRGIKYSYADLTVTKVYDLDATVAALRRIGNSLRSNPAPNKPDEDGYLNVFQIAAELKAQLLDLPKTFSNQQLWFLIPALRNASESHFFDFEVKAGSRDHEDALRPLD